MPIALDVWDTVEDEKEIQSDTRLARPWMPRWGSHSGAFDAFETLYRGIICGFERLCQQRCKELIGEAL